MNARARTKQESVSHMGFNDFSMSKDFLGMGIILALMVLSALAVVYVKDHERHIFSELQMTKSARDHLEVQWGQLLLEQSTWATPARVQTVAARHFAMHLPGQRDLVVVSA